jgi:hypothetical protein
LAVFDKKFRKKGLGFEVLMASYILEWGLLAGGQIDGPLGAFLTVSIVTVPLIVQ